MEFVTKTSPNKNNTKFFVVVFIASNPSTMWYLNNNAKRRQKSRNRNENDQSKLCNQIIYKLVSFRFVSLLLIIVHKKKPSSSANSV